MRGKRRVVMAAVVLGLMGLSSLAHARPTLPDIERLAREAAAIRQQVELRARAEAEAAEARARELLRNAEARLRKLGEELHFEYVCRLTTDGLSEVVRISSGQVASLGLPAKSLKVRFSARRVEGTETLVYEIEELKGTRAHLRGDLSLESLGITARCLSQENQASPGAQVVEIRGPKDVKVVEPTSDSTISEAGIMAAQAR